MISRKHACLCLLCAALGLPTLAARSARPIYKGAIMIDAQSGEVLWSDRPDEVSPPASMTKLMTYAVVDDFLRSGRLRLSTPIRITAADARVAEQADSTHVGLRAGEVFSVEELIYAMMIQSANDAAYALARATAGDVPSFVSLMNRKAQSLGMTRTLFRSPNGFPPRDRRIADGDLTTPRDFAALCRYLVLHTDVIKYTSVRTRLFGAGVRYPATPMHNHNNLLGRVTGVDGLKTGFTNGAGFCLAATALRNGRRLIVVVMDCPDSRDRDLKVAQLLNLGFAMRPFRPTLFAPAPRQSAAAGSGGSDAAPVDSGGIHFSVP